MPLEIERKFLVRNDDWYVPGTGIMYRQGYLSTVPERTVRVRLAQGKGFLTIKGVSVGAARTEYEYEIPADEAEEMLDHLCERPLVEKIRYRVEHLGLVWEIDRFSGDNEGLVIAEVELEDEGQALELPGWAGKEVTDDPRYYNANLINNPYGSWK